MPSGLKEFMSTITIKEAQDAMRRFYDAYPRLAAYAKSDVEITRRMFRMKKTEKKVDLSKLTKAQLLKKLRGLERVHKKLESDYAAMERSLDVTRRDYDGIHQKLQDAEAALPKRVFASAVFVRDGTLVNRIEAMKKLSDMQGAKLGRALTLIRQYHISVNTDIQKVKEIIDYILDGQVPNEL